jgi:hypothetical protein
VNRGPWACAITAACSACTVTPPPKHTHTPPSPSAGLSPKAPQVQPAATRPLCVSGLLCDPQPPPHATPLSEVFARAVPPPCPPPLHPPPTLPPPPPTHPPPHPHSPMCTAAIYWARLDKYFYAATVEDIGRFEPQGSTGAAASSLMMRPQCSTTGRTLRAPPTPTACNPPF